MLPRLRKGTAIRLRWKKHEADDKGADGFCDAWGGDVCLEDHSGICAEYPSAWSFYDFVYGSVPKKSAVPDLYLCVFKRFVFRLFGMVGSLFVHMDSAVGDRDAAAKENAAAYTAGCLYGSLCGTWIFIWDVVCAGAGGDVRA